MLGTTNARYNGEFEFNESQEIQKLNFKAGMSIAKGDLVEVISEELPDELPVPTVDVNSAWFCSLSMPTLLEQNKNTYQAFHMNVNAIATLAGTAGNHIFSSVWNSALTDITKTTALVASTQLSEQPSLNWGKPLYIGNGYWLIPGDDNALASITHTNRETGLDETYTYASQVLLVHIDQASGLATFVDALYNSGTTTWKSSWQYGKPMVFQIDENTYIFIHKTVIDGVYQVVAKSFTIKMGTEPEDTYLKWTAKDNVLMASGNTAFYFYGMCGHFVNKETKELFFLLKDFTTMGHLQVNEKNNSLILYTPTSFEVDLTPIREINHTVQTTLGVPLVLPVYNNLTFYNTITTEDGKHCLAVYNNYYWDFEIDYNTYLIYARVFPLRKKASYTIRNTHIGNEAATGTAWVNNYTLRDWDLVTSNLKGFRNQTGVATNNQLPCLYKVSDNKYLMAFLTTMTAIVGLAPETAVGTAVAQTTGITAPYGVACYAMLDYNDTLHTLKKDERFAFSGCFGNAVGTPDPALSKNIIFVDPNGYIHHIIPGYATGHLYTTSRSKYKLTNSLKNHLVYKYGTKNTSQKINYRRLYVGIANNSASQDEMVELITMPEQVSLLYKSLEEKEGNE